MKQQARSDSTGNAVFRILGACILGLGCFGVAIRAPAQTLDVNINKSAIGTMSEIPFRMYRDFAIVAEGAAGQRNKLHFLIDTGVSSTVIDDSLARKLRLTRSHKKISVFGHTILVEETVLPNLHLGPLQVSQLPVVVQETLPLQDVFSVRIDAIVGIDVLSQGSFTIDYEHRKLIWGPAAPLSDSVPCDPSLPFPTVPLQIGDRTLRVYIDTGAQDLALFENLTGLLPDAPVVSEETRTTLKGQAIVKTVELHELTLGTAHWGHRRGLLMQGSLFDGALGPRWLGAKRVHFDFERKVVSWSK